MKNTLHKAFKIEELRTLKYLLGLEVIDFDIGISLAKGIMP